MSDDLENLEHKIDRLIHFALDFKKRMNLSVIVNPACLKKEANLWRRMNWPAIGLNT